MIEAAKLEADIYPAGPRGLSAYEIYKKEGGQLSEEEWLKSLNGLTPTIGENGNWFLGTVDTGLPSRGPKGDTGSIKFIVVTELPTENIDETAIYLKPVESPTGENNFEELIYVNGKWENLGTPNVEVDLSNYYTKNETDNKIFESIPVFSLSDSEIDFNSNEWSTDSNTIENINKIINNNLGKFVTIVIRSTKPGQSKYVVQLNMCFDSPTALKSNTNQYITGICITNEDSISGVVGTKQFKLTYNVKEIGKINIIQLTSHLSNTKVSLTNNRDVLTKNNSTAYTPTADYHPATKKYVDDNVKTYTAGDNITISDDNVISSTIDGITTLTDELVVLGDLAPGYYILNGVKKLQYSNSSSNTYMLGNGTPRILITMSIFTTGKSTYGILYSDDTDVIMFNTLSSSYKRYTYSQFATKSELNAKQNKLTPGDNITIENNVISASGGDINDVGIYTWVYSDFPNTDNYNLKTKYNDFFKNMVNDAYSKGKKGIILMKTSNSTYGLNDKNQYTFTASNCDLQLKPTIIALYGNPLVTSVNFYQRVNFRYAQIRINGTWTDNTFEPESIYWDGITSVSFLSVDNMWNYTPKNNYNPATKKYVDDTIKTHYEKMTGYDATKTQVLKNINGTLTWVDEA